MRSITNRPRAASRRNPDVVIEPSGNASAAATRSLIGVSDVMASAYGNLAGVDAFRTLAIAGSPTFPQGIYKSRFGALAG
jgi:hypothetical protein